jgi:pimeloyl-ACP methyl ester carboxylesterase
MAVFVTVSGSHGGAWVWAQMRARLRAAGHELVATTLTGLGERVHLARPDTNLDTHIQDVVNVLVYEDLQQAVLVGGSYGGMVITGVADRVPERLAHVVYVDAMVPRDGEAVADLFPQAREGWLATARAQGDGWRIPPGKNAGPRAAAQPLQTYLQPIRLTNAAASKVPRTFIRCTNPRSTILDHVVERLQGEPGWRYRELASGHGAVLQAPRELTALLLETLQEDGREATLGSA